MKDINVKSDQQLGGITAGIINTSKGKKKPKSKLNKWVAIAEIVAAIVALLTFYFALFN